MTEHPTTNISPTPADDASAEADRPESRTSAADGAPNADTPHKEPASRRRG